MLTHPTHDRLLALGRPGIAKAIEVQRRSSALLRGLIYGPDGAAFSPTHTRKGGRASAALQHALHGTNPAERIVGRVVAKGLGGDGLGERIGLTIDCMDGRVHHIEVSSAKVDDIRRDSIVVMEPPPSSPRAVDRNILVATNADGIYSPANLPERGLAHDRQRFGTGPRNDELSHLSLDRQVRHEGTTWLDRTMLDGGRETMPHMGFGGDIRAAWDGRKQALADMGYVRNLGGGGFKAPTDLIARLERAEINRVGKAFAAERGLDWRPSKNGEPVSGKLVGQARLASGRFAMIDNGLGFSLVPWNNALEKRLGQMVSGIPLSGGGINWSFGRNLGRGL